MKRNFLTLLTIMGITLTVAAQDAVFSYFSYTGKDGRFNKAIDNKKEYLNPILAGFYPDPAVCRKGDTYYLVNSSFSFFPGVPIFESKDLVNWTQIGHVLDRESQLQLQGQWVSGGIYAPAIAYNKHNDTFYMITTNVGKGGNFYVKTKDPHQGWSDPIFLPEVDGIDPSFLFDDDGKAYIVHNAPVYGTADYDGLRAIRLLEFDVAGDSIVGQPIEIVRGGTHVTEKPIWIEGPHLYHIGKYYYLMCAEGGTGEGHSEVIFRAKNPKGPWTECPHNPILTQRDLNDDRNERVTCAGHADLIQTTDGNWWAVFLGCRPYEDNLYNTGRETFLLPVSWKDGWPTILEKGKAIPTVVEKAGLHTQVAELTGNFSYTDTFKGESLHPRWLFLRNPKADSFQLTANGLALRTTTGSIYDNKPMSAVFCRQQHATFTAETEIHFTPASSKTLAGMVLFQNEQNNIVFGQTMLNGRNAVILKHTEKNEALIGSAILPDNEAVKLKIEADGRYYTFSYSVGTADSWHVVATGVDGSHLSTARSGGFIGTMIGLYATKRNGK